MNDKKGETRGCDRTFRFFGALIDILSTFAVYTLSSLSTTFSDYGILAVRSVTRKATPRQVLGAAPFSLFGERK